jgi:hypothetical protein
VIEAAFLPYTFSFVAGGGVESGGNGRTAVKIVDGQEIESLKIMEVE